MTRPEDAPPMICRPLGTTIGVEVQMRPGSPYAPGIAIEPSLAVHGIESLPHAPCLRAIGTRGVKLVRWARGPQVGGIAASSYRVAYELGHGGAGQRWGSTVTSTRSKGVSSDVSAYHAQHMLSDDSPGTGFGVEQKHLPFKVQYWLQGMMESF
jgi:hypothetical protein